MSRTVTNEDLQVAFRKLIAFSTRYCHPTRDSRPSFGERKLSEFADPFNLFVRWGLFTATDKFKIPLRPQSFSI